jgi:hypothetical protein
MTLRELIAQAAEAEVGVRETKANGGKRIADYQSCTWLPIGPWPWCSAFVDFCVKSAVDKFKPVTFALPRTAGAWDLENWCRSVDDSVKLKKTKHGIASVERGDIVIFTFSHTGIATSSPDKDGNVSTIEGNTNSAGSREGDGVYRKTRHISKIRSIIKFTQ